MKSGLLIALMLPMLSWAGQQPVASLGDPSGDDHGNGALRYPQRTDFQAGDLDLIQLEVSRDEEGFWFEAKFKNPVRDPAEADSATGAEPLANFARKGFYQFNIDIYVDTDRVPGAGNTFTLPGRLMRIAPAFAWERAVILTPRPELMRQQLLDTLAEQFPERPYAETASSVDQAIFFPTRIRVRGRSIAFFVPASFFSGSDGKGWGITAFVTGAMTMIPADLVLFPTTRKPLERLQLGVMQPVPGHPRETFGYPSGAVAPGPVVDLLGAAGQETRQLAEKGELSGVHWGKVNDTPTGASDAQVVGQQAAGSAGQHPLVPIGNLLQPENYAAQTPASSDESSIAKRLQTLQQLFDRKLIDETEYKAQKQRILNAL